jgi:DNA processing protein
VADIANSYDREVFAVPGRTTDSQSVGCNNLIKFWKAHLLSNPLDVPYMLNWELEPDEKIIYNFLKDNDKELLDSIALRCEMPTYKIAGILLNMELKGIVRPLPGKLFELC